MARPKHCGCKRNQLCRKHAENEAALARAFKRAKEEEAAPKYWQLEQEPEDINESF